MAPTTPRHATPAGYEHTHGLASSAFARHYSRNHTCFLFLRVLRCFTSPRYHSTRPIHSGAGPHGHSLRDIPGFPIRTPPDHSSAHQLPRGLSQPHNVLHRLLVPRHPPYALHYLQQLCTTSTVQFSNNTHTTTSRRYSTKSTITNSSCGMTAPVICRYFLHHETHARSTQHRNSMPTTHL